jgi:hypothetical protein
MDPRSSVRLPSSFALAVFPALLLGGCIFVADGDGHGRHHHASGGALVRGSGISRTEGRTVGEFTRIVVESSWDVDVNVGGPRSLSVTGDDNLLDRVTTEVVGGVLRIGTRPGSTSTRIGLRVSVTVPSLDGVEVRGSADVAVGGVAGESFAVAVQGSGDLRATGKVAKLAASVSGSGDLDLGGIEAVDAKVSVTGSGDVVGWATETLTVSIAGCGDVRYRGSPKVTKSVAGSGEVVGR